MRLALIAPSLSEGGTARVLCTLADGWVARGQEVTVVTLAGTEEDVFPLDEEVGRIGLEAMAASSNPVAGGLRNLRRLWALRSALRRIGPDVAVAFLHRTAVRTVLAATGTGVPVVVSERADPRHDTLSIPWRVLRRLTYRRASALVVQTEEVAAWAERWLPADRIHVVPNPVRGPADGPRGHQLPSLSVPTPHAVVGMGRLTHQKGFDLLLEAFARAARERPDWSLVILGQGPEREPLEALAGRLDVADRVRLPGHVRSPWERLETVDLFVLSSRYEGFPNVLLEAMARGIACVSFDCPTGPSEIVRHGEDGLLVPDGDVGALAAAMARLMGDPETRRGLGRRARSVVDRFAVDRVLDRWEEVLASAPG